MFCEVAPLKQEEATCTSLLLRPGSGRGPVPCSRLWVKPAAIEQLVDFLLGCIELAGAFEEIARVYGEPVAGRGGAKSRDVHRCDGF